MKKVFKLKKFTSFPLKFDLKMKLTTLLLIVTLFQLQANESYSQKTKITLDLENVSVENVLNKIESLTEFKFFYFDNEVDYKQKVSLKVKKEPISKVLKRLFTNSNIEFVVLDKQITLIVKKASVDDLNLKSSQETKKGDNRQGLNITGTVTDENNQPLPGANIIEKGTNNGVQTDFDGIFSISLTNKNVVLIVSYLGFTTKEVNVQGQTQMSIVLEENASNLDEVVIVGYGSVKKSDLTGAVSSLSSDDLTQSVSSNVAQQLSGRAAGVQVFQNSNEPGGGANIQIRGVSSINAANQPLFVVDGLPIDNGSALSGGNLNSRNPPNPLNSINPGDIQSIQVLKDASATAIYGSRGANGVIIITTKSGKSGKLKVTYETSFSISEVSKRADLLNATEYQTVLNELIDAGAVNGSESERVTTIVDGGTDWQNEIYQSAPVKEHTLSFSGGNEKTTFFSSLNYFNQEGLVVGSELERFAVRLNLNTKVSDKFKYGFNLTSSYVKNKIKASGPSPNDNNSVIGSANEYDPSVSVFENEETGLYFQSPFLNKENPLAILNGIFEDDVTWRTLSSIYGEYFMTPEFSAKLNLGVDYQGARKDIFQNDKTLTGRAANGIGNIFNGTAYNYLVEGTLNYQKTFNEKHTLTLLAGATTQKFFSDYANLGSSDFLSLSTETNNLQSGNIINNTVSSGRVESTLLSYLGRVNYAFSDKYLVTGTIRIDGSSKFGENNKYAYFPSMALAWKLHKEDFMSSADIFDELKLRGSYGQTGNQEIGNFNSLTTIRAGGNAVLTGDRVVVTATPSRIANPDLKWETTTQANIGLDWAIKGRRITGSIDYYNKKTEDLLFNVPIPSQTGFNTQLSNIGSVKNYGLEFFVDAHILTGKLKWNTSVNLTTVNNEVLDIGGVDEIVGGGSSFSSDLAILKPGEVMNSYYGWEVLGVWQTDDDYTNAPVGVAPGDWKFADLNEDGAITSADRKIIGNSIPDLTWGLTNLIEYKGVTLSANVVGVHGVQMFNDNLRYSFYPINFRRNKLAEPYLNRWTPDNPTNEYASFINPFSQGQNFVNTRTVEDASYVRLQNVALGFNVPLKNDNIFKSLNIEVSGSNLYTWTNYSGPDPGVNIDGTASAGFRYDYAGVPLSRTFSMSLRAEF